MTDSSEKLPPSEGEVLYRIGKLKWKKELGMRGGKMMAVAYETKVKGQHCMFYYNKIYRMYDGTWESLPETWSEKRPKHASLMDAVNHCQAHYERMLAPVLEAVR